VDPKVHQTLEAYPYAGSDPVNGTDPSGMFNVAFSKCGQYLPGGPKACPSSHFSWSIVIVIAEVAGVVVLGVATDGIGDVALVDLEGTTDVADAIEEASAAASNGGESAATAYGRLMHATWDYGPGFEREYTLDNGLRADAVNLEEREVVELKPNNPSAIARGLRQVKAYAEQLDKQFPGKPFTYRVITYTRP
jgi:hypothetical protein